MELSIIPVPYIKFSLVNNWRTVKGLALAILAKEALKDVKNNGHV